jgi:NAD(P)-dependent dehydrogenase (short-subunit alcohol dehydrogenase family)
MDGISSPAGLLYRFAFIQHSGARMSRLKGRTAIVTGGAVGIGRHYSEALAAQGAEVMVADIVDGSAVAAGIAAKYGRNATTSMTFDVSDEGQVKALVAKTLERFGKIDILVNNAALYAPLPTLKVEEIDVDLWDRVMAVNIRGPFLMVKHVVPHMIARKYGKIVNIGSGTAARGIPNFSHYVTSKGAVTAFTRAISRELGEHGICVNTLAPGYTLSETGLQNAAHVAQSKAAAVQRRALKRDEYPEDLLGTLIYLCSSDSDFVTGQVLAVDGGANNT